MKKLLGSVLAAVLLITSAGCVSSNSADSKTTASETTAEKMTDVSTTEQASAESVELSIFAAASMTETLAQIKTKFEAENSGITLVFNLDSSGTLKTQIEEGAEADIFISAAQKQVDGLAEGGYISEETRKNILENKVVLIVPEGSGKGIASFEDCATEKVGLIALGNSDVPVGQYSEEIFTYLKLWDAVAAKASYASTVKEVLSQVENASVDCGVVYATDAAAASGVKVVCEAAADTHSPVVYPAAMLTASKNAEAAKKFLDYLSSDDAKAIFEAAGFTTI